MNILYIDWEWGRHDKVINIYGRQHNFISFISISKEKLEKTLSSNNFDIVLWNLHAFNILLTIFNEGNHHNLVDKTYIYSCKNYLIQHQRINKDKFSLQQLQILVQNSIRCNSLKLSVKDDLSWLLSTPTKLQKVIATLKKYY